MIRDVILNYSPAALEGELRLNKEDLRGKQGYILQEEDSQLIVAVKVVT